MSRNYSRPTAIKTRIAGAHVYYGSDTGSSNYIGCIEKGDGRNQWNIELAADYGDDAQTFSGTKAEAAEQLTTLYKEAIGL